MVKSSFNWSTWQLHNPVPSIQAVPAAPPKKLARVQHKPSPSRKINVALQEARRIEIRRVMEKSWNDYRDHAWMCDEVTPLSGEGKDTFGGWAATLVVP